MPHVIELNHGPVQYPERCPYCESHAAETRIRRLFLRASSAKSLPGAATDAKETLHLEYPSCRPCGRFFFRSKWVALSLVALPWAGTGWMAWNRSQPLGARTFEFSMWGAALLSVIALGTLAWRQFRLSRFRVGRIGPSTTAYYCRSGAYARDFARVNGSQSQFKLIDLGERQLKEEPEA